MKDKMNWITIIGLLITSVGGYITYYGVFISGQQDKMEIINRIDEQGSRANKIQEEALNLTKKINQPFLDVRLNKFADDNSYFKAEKTDKDVLITYQLVLTNAGKVPITNLSCPKLISFSKNVKIPNTIEIAFPPELVIGPGLTKVFNTSIGMIAENKTIDESFESATKDNAVYEIEITFEYYSTLDKKKIHSTTIGYRFSKKHAIITKNQMS